MKTESYIKELKKHLSLLDRAKREEIVKEIESYVDEKNADYELLVERFGKPEDLAKNYLEDVPVEEQKVNSFLKKLKNMTLTVIIFLIVVISIIAVAVYFMTKDPFDYSKYSALTIMEKIEVPWIELNTIEKFDIAQSKVVVYWSDEKIVKVSCKNSGCDEDDENNCLESKNILKEGSFIIKQSSCYLSLPKEKIDIKTYQSKLILIEPNAVNINSKQSKIEIAEGQNSYNYTLLDKQSSIDSFDSTKDGILIEGELYQSKMARYKY